jgi:hypothetical protein
MTSSLSWYGATGLRAKAMAGLSALLGVLMVASTSAPVVAQLMGHFGISYGDAVWVIALVSAGSIVLFWVFPYLIPFIGTIRLLMIYFGAAVVIGW